MFINLTRLPRTLEFVEEEGIRAPEVKGRYLCKREEDEERVLLPEGDDETIHFAIQRLTIAMIAKQDAPRATMPTVWPTSIALAFNASNWSSIALFLASYSVSTSFSLWILPRVSTSSVLAPLILDSLPVQLMEKTSVRKRIGGKEAHIRTP